MLNLTATVIDGFRSIHQHSRLREPEHRGRTLLLVHADLRRFTPAPLPQTDMAVVTRLGRQAKGFP